MGTRKEKEKSKRGLKLRSTRQKRQEHFSLATA